MTKEQIQSEYQKIATKAGDAFFRLQSIDAARAKVHEELTTLSRQKQALEVSLVNAKDGSDEPRQAPVGSSGADV